MQTQLFGPLRYSAGMAYRSVGDGPVLVLLHGGSGSRTHWSRNVFELSQRFKVVTVDLPGFGQSATPPDPIDPSDYLEWVADSLALFLRDEPVFHLAGFSFGGAVTAATAAILARRGRAPRRVSLLSPAGFGKPVGRSVQLEKVSTGGNTSEQEIRAATARNLGRWMLYREPAANDAAVDIHLQNVAQARFDSRQISHRNSVIADLQAAPVPVQIILGTADPLIFPSLEARRATLTEAVPGARIQTITDAGHWLAYEASGTVNALLAQFHLQGEPNGI